MNMYKHARNSYNEQVYSRYCLQISILRHRLWISVEERAFWAIRHLLYYGLWWN